MASDLSNLDTTSIANNSTATSNKSLFIGNYNSSPMISIFSGIDQSILGNTLGNLDKIFFHSGFDYLRVRSAVTFNISLPARNTRSSGGGKKGGSGLTSYNGFSDYYIYQHSYGSPPPAFSLFLNSSSSTGGTMLGSGTALAGSVPIQFVSNNSFRLALVYSTDRYLVLRERYQVYQNSLPALTMSATAYFYNNPTSINAVNALSIVHSPLTFNDVSPYNSSQPRGRSYSTGVSFTAVNGTTFDKVEVMRYGGGAPNSFGNPYKVYAINGSSVTQFDPYNVYTTVVGPGSQTTTFSMNITVTDVPKTTAIGKAKYIYYTPRYYFRFTNTSTGQQFTDSWGGVISFYFSA